MPQEIRCLTDKNRLLMHQVTVSYPLTDKNLPQKHRPLTKIPLITTATFLNPLNSIPVPDRLILRLHGQERTRQVRRVTLCHTNCQQ